MRVCIHFRFALAILLLAGLSFACSDDDGGNNREDDGGSDSDTAGPFDEITGVENATCEDKDGGKICVCKSGFVGDGKTCDPEGDWEQHTIGTQNDPIYVYTADLDNDGDRDVLATSSNHEPTYKSEIAWYRNENKGSSWTKFVIGSPDEDVPVFASNGIVASDLNQDGLLEVAVASGQIGKTHGPGGVYLYTTAEDPTGQWARQTLHYEEKQGFAKIYAADMNEDGFGDIIVGGSSRGIIFLHPGDGGGDWTTHSMNDQTGGNIFLADIDGDGKQDIINVSTFFGKISWTKVTVEGNALSYVDTPIGDVDFPFDVYAVDVNQDSRLDVICSRIAGFGVRWFAQGEDPDGAWTENMIVDDFAGTDIFAADLNNDGIEDISVAGLAMMIDDKPPKSMAWFERYEEAGEIQWRHHWIAYDSPTLTIPGDQELADINGDGRPDLVTTSMEAGNVVWFENKIGN